MTWHPDLPPPPADFPEQATLALTREEAEFLRDRIVFEHPRSLLAWLVRHPAAADTDFPWQHPDLNDMSTHHRHELHHARMFSEVMRGAPLLYNRMLCEALQWDEKVAEYVEESAEWVGLLDRPSVEKWVVDELFALARGHGGHGVSPQAEHFVRQWAALVREDPVAIPERDDARKLIRQREGLLKGSRSLFTNRRALEERYGGRLGLVSLSYRWPGVQVLLRDLYEGLEGP